MAGKRQGSYSSRSLRVALLLLFSMASQLEAAFSFSPPPTAAFHKARSVVDLRHQQLTWIGRRSIDSSGSSITPLATSAATALSSSTSSSSQETITESFIDTQLRGAAMRLHTREQAPKEGKAQSIKKMEPYIPTRADYLAFLVDSKHVYEAMEDIVNKRDELAMFRNTGLERTIPLEQDIQFMVTEYGLQRPEVGAPGKDYALVLKKIESIPEFVCHFYNWYFAHTAGGRMIGKQMSALLLNKRTLEFYKWEGDLNEIKRRVKTIIEDMAAEQWSPEERQECVDATAAAFKGGGAVNSHLSGGQSPH